MLPLNTATPPNLPWCTAQYWMNAFPVLKKWQFFSHELPPALQLRALTGQSVVVVEHPWQARWLQHQWQDALAGEALDTPSTVAACLPQVLILNVVFQEHLAAHYPHAMSTQTASLTVWRAVQSLKKTSGFFGQNLRAYVPSAKWALAQQLVKLLSEVQILAGVTPQLLDRLENSQAIWLSREAQWFKAVRESLTSIVLEPKYEAQTAAPWWLHQQAILQRIVNKKLAVVMPAAHPGANMQAFLALLPEQQIICLPDLETPLATGPVKVLSVHCQDFEQEAQHAANWVIEQKQMTPTARLAIVAHNRALARRIGALLARKGVAADDRVGWAVSTTMAASHVKGLLDVIVQEDAVALMQWLAMPKVQEAWPAAFECCAEMNHLWRQQTIIPQGGALIRLALQKSENIQVKTLLKMLLGWQLEWSKPSTVAQHAQALLDALGPLAPAMREDGAGSLVWRCMESLLLEPNIEAVPFNVFGKLLQSQFEDSRYAPAVPNAAVQFLPLHEAGWTELDAVLMVGCNELHFPSAPRVIAPLLGSVRRELGLPALQAEMATWKHVQRQSAKVFASYTTQENGNPTRISPWLQGLCAPHETEIIARATPPLALPSSPQYVGDSDLVQTQAVLDGLVLPKRLSVTQLAKLSLCPYQFMLSAAVHIKAFPEPSLWPDQRERGNLLHETLHHGVQFDTGNLNQALHDALSELALKLAPLSGRYTALIDDARRLIPPFLAAHAMQQTEGWQIHATEAAYASPHFFENLELYGKLDRVDIKRVQAEPKYALIDYKTSSLQTLKQKIAMPQTDAQLLLYAALLRTQGLEVVQAMYWRLGEQAPQASLLPVSELEQNESAILGGFEQAWDALLKGASAKVLPSKQACQYCDYAGICRSRAILDDDSDLPQV